MIRITSDGTSIGSHVYQDGVELTDLVKVEILPITPNSHVCARLTFQRVELELTQLDLFKETNDGNKLQYPSGARNPTGSRTVVRKSGVSYSRAEPAILNTDINTPC